MNPPRYTQTQRRRGGINSGRARRRADPVKGESIRQLREKGLSWRAVGEAMGMSASACLRLWNRLQERAAGSQVPNLLTKDGGATQCDRSWLTWRAGRLTARIIRDFTYPWVHRARKKNPTPKYTYRRAYVTMRGRLCWYMKPYPIPVLRKLKVRSLLLPDQPPTPSLAEAR